MDYGHPKWLHESRRAPHSSQILGELAPGRECLHILMATTARSSPSLVGLKTQTTEFGSAQQVESERGHLREGVPQFWV